MAVKETEGRWGIRMSKRELQQVLASGGLSLIATPKRKASATAGREHDFSGLKIRNVEVVSVGNSRALKIEGVEVEGVTVIEKVPESGQTGR